MAHNPAGAIGLNVSWCANLGQSFVACVLGVITGFWSRYAALALVLLILGTLNGSSGQNKLAGYAVFGASALGLCLFLSLCSVALGGQPYQLGRPLRS